MFNGNIQYEIAKPRTIMDPISDNKKLISSRTLAGRELISMLEGMVEVTQFVVDDHVIEMNELRHITEMIINSNELDNSDNLEDGRPSNVLLITLLMTTILHVLNPTRLPYKRLKTESLLP